MRDDIHALSGAYAVDALDDDERALFELHLAACSACQYEVNSLVETAALLAEATVSAPSAQLRERVLAGIATVRPLPPVVPAGAHRAAPVDGALVDGAHAELDHGSDYLAGHRADHATVTPLAPRRRRRAASFLAAAAAVVAIGTGGVVWHSVSQDDRSGTNDVASAVISAPDHQTYTENLADGRTATVYRSASLDKAVLVTKGFPKVQSGKELALWLIHDGTPVPAGVLPAGTDNEIVLSGDAATATAAGITVEDAGSTLSEPSGPMVANIDFQET